LKHFHNVGVPRFLQWSGFQGDGSRIFLKRTVPGSDNFDTQQLKQIVKINIVQL